MAKISQVKQDTAALTGGRWFPWKLDIELLIRPFPNKESRKRTAELMKRHKAIVRAAPDSDLAREATDKVTRRVIAETVLIGWRNLEDDDGPIEYSADTAEKLLSQPEMQHLLDEVVMMANDSANFLAQDEAEDLGN